MSSFEFCLDSGIIEGYEASKNYFSVESVEEASSWVKTIESVILHCLCRNCVSNKVRRYRSTLGTIVQYEKIASTTVDFRSAMDLQDDASYSRPTFSSHEEPESPEPNPVAEKIPGVSDEIKMLVGRLFSVA